MPAIVMVLMASGADAGRMPDEKSPTCRSLPFIGGPAFAICADNTMRTVFAVRLHGERRTEIADERGDDVAAPFTVVPVSVTAAQPDRRRVDRLLSQRPKPFALEGASP